MKIFAHPFIFKMPQTDKFLFRNYLLGLLQETSPHIYWPFTKEIFGVIYLKVAKTLQNSHLEIFYYAAEQYFYTCELPLPQSFLALFFF